MRALIAAILLFSAASVSANTTPARFIFVQSPDATAFRRPEAAPKSVGQ